jgi:hypothetical protein
MGKINLLPFNIIFPPEGGNGGDSFLPKKEKHELLFIFFSYASFSF